MGLFLYEPTPCRGQMLTCINSGPGTAGCVTCGEPTTLSALPIHSALARLLGLDPASQSTIPALRDQSCPKTQPTMPFLAQIATYQELQGHLGRTKTGPRPRQNCCC